MATQSRSGAKSGWATGLALFAAVMMLMIGLFQSLQGLAAIVEDTFFVKTKNYVYQFDVTTWGWIHLAIGIVVAVAGWALLSGRLWARATAMVLAVLSALANFLFIPYYPLWSLLMIALSIAVIWALAVFQPENS
jgi:hypothetical protein